MNTFFTLLFLIVTNGIVAQSVNFAHAYGGSDYDYGSTVTSDSAGNIYTGGYFRGLVDFDQSVNVNQLDSYGTRDGFILKLDAAGNFIWVKQMACTNPVYIQKIILNDLGEIYVAGLFRGTMTLETTTGTTDLVSSGNFDAFVLKLDANGDLIWGQKFGSHGRDEAIDLILEPNGNLLVVGGFLRTVDFDNSSNEFQLTSFSTENADIFLLKLSPDGDFIWVKQFGGTGEDYAESITVGQSGAIYMTGYYKRGEADFDPGPDTYILPNPGTFDKIFVVKLTAEGNFVWAKQTDGFHLTRGNAIEVDTNENVYIGGYFYATQDFNPDPNEVFELHNDNLADIFIWKLDTYGNFISVQQIANSSWSQIYGSAKNAQGDIYFLGEYHEALDFNFSGGSHIMTSVGQAFDMFVLKYNQNDSFGGAISIGGENLINGTGIHISNQGNILVTGGFYAEAITIDTGQDALTLDNIGLYDAFILSFGDAALSVQEPFLENNIQYFPNPVSHTLTIDSKNEINEIAVYDMLGKLVMKFSDFLKERIELDFSSLSNGLYQILLKDDNSVWPIKILKH
ncbi:putative secreted protein (Por secretion system target) [Winogradskyella epiphytica]|uniref:Putative secreted protein (Por secretion system target) n=1 Tax=Winogradskyella epiphytica TaxID=262005 RepID=A0A2V4XJS8_9FLAO|nr:T9SS type A sorting domain-containing protein [Winogradskyella epiphytica]PYE83580.1 putative secreted protein (Por secretion system target) [Winogradskyella epiphytica]GGW59155.1 hypothetical protein GCM10008085_08720 [Winogradskyella epiphytica]